MAADMKNPAGRHRVLNRWRVTLGRSAERAGLGDGLEADSTLDRAGELLDFLYPEDGEEGGPKGAGGGSDGLTIPTWVDGVGELFPSSAKEVMERELVRRRGLGELLQKPELLERIEPNLELVKTLLTHRELMNPETRVLARKIIDRVVTELKQKLRLQVEPAITGALRRDRHSPRKVVRNLDLKMTIRRNLQNWDDERKKLLADRLFFFAAERNQRPWHVIVLVDQSGSMLESAIFSAVMASIFAELPSMRTSLVLFDTRVADLSDQVGQPVDVLLSVQLGGGTDIARAVDYGASLVREPARTILVLITDFYEGGNPARLVTRVGELAQAGVRCVGLGALGYNARPQYDRQLAGRCRKAGMDILSCTPERLAESMAQIISGRG